jgi:hypothetical protein
MQPLNIHKFLYQIRSRNGVIVDNLQIYGHTEDEARLKLNQMYHHCEILSTQVAMSGRSLHSSYEDVLNLIVDED